jgi:hypothetical protein
MGVNWVLQVMEKSLVNWGVFKEQLKGILGPKVQEVAEGQRKIQTPELRNSSLYVPSIGEIRNEQRIYFGKLV